MFISNVEKRGKVNFPENTLERIYMYGFYQKDGLPHKYSRWQNTVDMMLKGIKTTGRIFLMVDQGYVKANTSHRRNGALIDGYWMESLGRHGTGRHGTHIINGMSDEGILLASDVKGCEAYKGKVNGIPGKGGDCSHIPLSDLDKITMEENVCYAGNVGMVHESIPVETDCMRTLVRLNVQHWSPAL